MAIPGIFERPPGSGVWWISYLDADGVRRREKAGKMSAALDLVAARRLQVRKGELIPPRQHREWTFRRLAEAAIAAKRQRLAPATITTDNLRLGRLLPLLGGIRFDRVTPEKIEGALTQLRSLYDLSTSTLNRYRSLISSVFSFAVRAGRVAANPATRVQRYPENDSRVRWLRADEISVLRGVLQNAVHEAEFDLALHTGMRRGEQWGLRWRDVDIQNRDVKVKGKTGERHVTLNSTAIAALESLRALSGAGEFVVPDANARPASRDMRSWFEDGVRAAGIVNFRWHDLRHTFASTLVINGVHLRNVQELLGHKSIVTTMKYAHLSSGHLREAVEKMNDEEAETMSKKSSGKSKAKPVKAKKGAAKKARKPKPAPLDEGERDRQEMHTEAEESPEPEAAAPAEDVDPQAEGDKSQGPY
jgi:site-specific recombinase XerD